MKINYQHLFRNVIPVFFDHEDPVSNRGRRVMLANGIFANLAANLSGGVFYTGFLLANHIDITQIGIISFVPYIASIFSIFSPMILERFEKRKWILFWSRIVYYVINILGITLLPYVIPSESGRLIGFTIIVFTANAINFTFTSGYSVWHIQFLPEKIRARYFSLYQLLVNAIVQGTLLISSLIADSLSGTPHELTILVIFRIIAMLIAVADCTVLLLPKEFPYPKNTDKLKITDAIVKPVRNRKYFRTMLLYYIYVFACSIFAGVLNTYLLQTIHVSYSVINGINALYFIFFIFFGSFWQNMISRIGWIKTLGVGYLISIPGYILFAFINPVNQVWIYPVVRLSQHFYGVGHSIVASNLPFLNMPKENSTNYMSFHYIAYHFSVLIAMILGTWIVSLMGDTIVNLGLFSLDSVQLLLMANALVTIPAVYLCFKWNKDLEPKEEPNEDSKEDSKEDSMTDAQK